MVSVCPYFHVHQPYRLAKYSVFDIGKSHKYFDDLKNKAILDKIAEKCYIPANAAMLELLNKYEQFKISYSISGVAIEQFENHRPDVLDSFIELANTGKVEFIGETYYHSLSFMYSKNEFKRQILLHTEKIKKIFHKKPTIFRNTELIYNNELALMAEMLGYKGILAEGADRVLGWRSPNFLYKPKGANIKLLLKNYRLSDDIAFRFSNHDWSEWPLNAKKYADWINKANGNGNVVNLFMDYETFGEHQWKETGIFDFIKSLPKEILKNPDNDFVTPSQSVARYDAVGELDVPDITSWADLERDASAWIGNPMQKSAIKEVYAIENRVLETEDESIISDWRKLQISDHFYYMCTKWFADGDVHKYFNPYDSPYDAFIAYMNILSDINLRVKAKINIHNVQ